MRRVGHKVSLLLLALGLASAAGAGVVHPDSTSTKVRESDAIFVGKVVEIKKPDPGVDGVDEYVIVEVAESLKGHADGSILKFVTKGAMPASNPDCCVIGHKYLFFARNGYRRFFLKDNDIKMGTEGKNEFFSETNGQYSTYRILDDGMVQHWPKHRSHSGDVAYSVVAAQVRKIAGKQNRGH